MKEILITSSALILVIVLFRQFFRNKVSRRLQYGLWLLVVLRLLIPIQFGQSDYSVTTLTEKMESQSKPIQQFQQTLQEPVVGPSRAELYEQLLDEYLLKEESSAETEAQTPALPEAPITPAIREQIEAEVEEQITAPTISELLTAIWIGGAVVIAVWFTITNLSFLLQARRNSTPWKIPSPVRVRISPNVPTPCLVGLFRPTIYLTPRSIQNETSLKHILTHELTHLRHGDHFWSLARCICLCIYWFDPMVWLAAILSKRDCELACDEAALSKLGDDQRIAYSKTLLATVSQSRSPAHILETATAMNETKKQLKERVNRIVKKQKTLLTAAIALTLIAALAAGCAFTGSKPTESPATEPATTEPPATQPTEPTLPAPACPTDPPSVTAPPSTEPNPTVPNGIDPGEPIPTLPPESASYQSYRDVYYKIYTDYLNLLTEEQHDDWILYYNEIYRPQINNNEWSANRMLLVTFVQRYDISRENFDRATTNFLGRLAVYDWDHRHIETEIPNGDIIYSFDDDVINEYYLMDSPIYEPPPAFTVQSNSSSPDSFKIPSPDSIEIQDFLEDDYDFDREYRDAYYRCWIGFLPLLGDDQRQEYLDWVHAFQLENNAGRDQQEMLLVAAIKHFDIPKEAFEQAVAYYIAAAEAIGCNLSHELYEPPNADIIYTFDNEIINDYYRIQTSVPVPTVPTAAEELIQRYNLYQMTSIFCDYEIICEDMSEYLTESQRESYWNQQYRITCCHTAAEVHAHTAQRIPSSLTGTTLPDDRLFWDDDGNLYLSIIPTDTSWYHITEEIYPSENQTIVLADYGYDTYEHSAIIILEFKNDTWMIQSILPFDGSQRDQESEATGYRWLLDELQKLVDGYYRYAADAYAELLRGAIFVEPDIFLEQLAQRDDDQINTTASRLRSELSEDEAAIYAKLLAALNARKDLTDAERNALSILTQEDTYTPAAE